MNSRNFAIIGGIITLVVVIGIVAIISDGEQTTDPKNQNPDIGPSMNETSNTTKQHTEPKTGYDASRPREWLTSGPFQIDRSEYALGEKIFFRINNIEPHERGQAVFLRPLNDTHYSVYVAFLFDGQKPSANTYFTPDVNKAEGICSIDDIAGEWVLTFRGTNYPNIKFTVSDSMYVPGEEDRFKAVC